MTELHGTWPLVRLTLRRDRFRLLAWVVGITAVVIGSAISTKGLYPTQHDLDEAAFLARDNPVTLAFNGPDLALDTIGGQIAFQIGAFGFLMVGLMSVLLTGRVTRGEEDSGRLELVRAMPVGRHAPLAAGLIVVAATCALLGVATAVSLVLQDLPTSGSILLGASYLAFGLAFEGLTIAAAQVSDNPRVATGTAGGVLGASFVLRAVGDIGDGTLSWLSPMGWAQQAGPYAYDRWWPLALCLLLGAGFTWLAVALTERRDFGSGLVRPKPGPPTAARGLGTPLGLAVRLHRVAVLWWGLGTLALGLVYGSLAEAIEDFVSDNEALTDMLAALGDASLVDSYLATSVLIVSLLATGPALQIALRLGTEETELRAEAMLATPASRPRWMASHLVVALAGSALALVLGGAGLGIAYAATGGGAHQVPRLVGAALTYVPAVWALAGLAVALFGRLPRWIVGAWVAFAGCFVIAMFGTLLDLPTWLVNLSPFQHVPPVPADSLRLLPLAALCAVAGALMAFGFSAFRARDLVAA